MDFLNLKIASYYDYFFHLTKGWPTNKPTKNLVSHTKNNEPRISYRPVAGASKFRTQWGRKQSNWKERV